MNLKAMTNNEMIKEYLAKVQALQMAFERPIDIATYIKDDGEFFFAVFAKEHEIFQYYDFLSEAENREILEQKFQKIQ